MNTLHEIYSQAAYLDKYRMEKFENHLSKRFGSIGRARRFEQFNDLNSPGPGRYDPNGLSSLNNAKITKFGRNPRELSLGLHQTLGGTCESPGPGCYNLPKINGKSFSFAQKFQEKNNNVPGPGEYRLDFRKFRAKAVVFGSEVRKDNFLNPELSRNPEPWRYNVQQRDHSPKWKFSTEARVKKVDLSKLGVFEAISLSQGRRL
jgi:hypothetical protein